MNLYMVRRRSGWADGSELEAGGAKSGQVADDNYADDIRWIRSYVVEEEDGTLGTFCVYQASGEQAIRDHADEVGMPASEITQIADTVIVRPDPEPTTA